jgi:hypothetical protein
VPYVGPEPLEAPHSTLELIKGDTPKEAIASKQEEQKQLVQRATLQFEASSSWDEFVNKSKDSRGDLYPSVAYIPRRAAHLLNRIRVWGATVATKSEPWSLQQNIAAFNRDSHQLASQHVEFLCSEFVDMLNAGQWILLPTRSIVNARNLRLRPLGVVP